MLTIAYIGNRKSTNRYHLPFVLQRKDIKVKTIYQRNPKNEKWSRIIGANYTSNLHKILDDEEIQLIVVCTMHNSHYDYAKMVLEHNKHCLVEKPFMETSKQAKEILKLAKEKVKSVKGDYGRVYDDLYEAIINGKDKTITDEQILLQMEILETGVKDLR